MKSIFICLIILFSATNIAFSENLPPITLKLKPSEKAIVEPIISKSLSKALKYYRTNFGIILTRPFLLVATQDPNFITKIRYEANNRRYTLKDLHATSKNRCKSKYKFNAAIDPKVFFICFNPPNLITKKWLRDNQKIIDLIIKHELMHMVQRQLSNSNYIMANGRQRHGPIWLAEGTAVYAEKDYILLKKDRRQILRTITNKLKDTTTSLKEIHKGGSRLSVEDYALSEFSAYLLIERYGMEQMFEYLRKLKNGSRWERAFKKTFGIDMNDFMQDVEVLRLSAAKAERWITAE